MSEQQRYQIIEQIGSGAYGVVHSAYDSQLNQEVAIKSVPPTADEEKKRLNEHLITDSQTLAGLLHPNIVTIYDIKCSGSSGNIVMELLKGITLDALIHRHLLCMRDFRYITAPIISALAAAHSSKVYHADIKPANAVICMLANQQYEVKILGFGISPEIGKIAEDSSYRSNKARDSIYYAAPELLKTGSASAQSDLYSLGCLFYFLLTGIHPFHGESIDDVIAAHTSAKYIPLKEIRPDLSEEFCHWVNAHLCTDHTKRIQTCKESLEQLNALTISNVDENFSLDSSIASMASRDVRPLTSQSINPAYYSATPSNDSARHDIATTQPIQFTDAQQKEAQKKLNPSLQPPPKKGPVPLSQRVVHVPAEAQWYFSINDNRKGPVDFKKICSLISEGILKADDLVWHPRFGEWNPISTVPEFKDEISQGIKAIKQQKKEKHEPKKELPVASMQTAAPALAKPAQTHAPAKATTLDESLDQFHWFGGEFIYAIVATVATGAFIWFHPTAWQFSLLILAACSLVAGFLFMRIHMKRDHGFWLFIGILLPIISDLLYTLLHPIKGFRSMLLYALAAVLIHFCIQHRYHHDTFDFIGYSDPVTEVTKLSEDLLARTGLF